MTIHQQTEGLRLYTDRPQSSFFNFYYAGILIQLHTSDFNSQIKGSFFFFELKEVSEWKKIISVH